MNQIDDVSLVKAYYFEEEEGKLFLIKESDMNEALLKFGSILNIPIDYTLSAEELVYDGITSNVFKIAKSITVSKLNKVKERLVRCSNFSI